MTTKRRMPSISVEGLIERKCCWVRQYGESEARARLATVFDGEEELSARQLFDKVQYSLADRVWAASQAEPDLDWASIAEQLHSLVDPERYSGGDSRGYGSDAHVAARHIELYAAEIGSNSLIAQANNIVRGVLP